MASFYGQVTTDAPSETLEISKVGLEVSNVVAKTTNEQQDTMLIPLKEIWAYEMPGTRDIRKLNPSDKDLAELIQQLLGRKTSNDDTKPGFVVQGEGMEALQEAYDVLVSVKPAEKKLDENRKTWIVFFSHNSSHYVHLTDARRKADQITILFRFVPHDSKELTRHFALIPLGNLPAAEYTVSAVNSPMEQRYIEAGFRPMHESYVSKIVCGDFEFVVNKNLDD